jgi:hypothetical protein
MGTTSCTRQNFQKARTTRYYNRCWINPDPRIFLLEGVALLEILLLTQDTIKAHEKTEPNHLKILQYPAF